MNRRTVVRGAAWSVPAIAIGVAAPAEAASSPVECSGTLIWDHSQPFTVDHYKTLTFNYGFRSNWDSEGPAVCYVQLSVDGRVVHTEQVTLLPGRSADGHTYQTDPLESGPHIWSITVTAPGFNTLSANGKFTTK